MASLGDQLAASDEAFLKAMEGMLKGTNGGDGSQKKKVKVEIDAKVTGKEQIKDFVNNLDKADKKTKNVKSNLKLASKDIDKLAEKMSKSFGDSLEKVSKQIDEIKKKLSGDGSGLTVRINHEGFDNIVKTLDTAINNFNRRKGNSKKNFFEVAFGTRENNKKSTEEAVKQIDDAAKEATKSISESFSDEKLISDIQSALAKAVAEGIKKGAKDGIKAINVSSTDKYTAFVGELIKGAGLKPKGAADYIKSITRTATGKIDPLETKRLEKEERLEMARIEAKKQEHIAIRTAASKNKYDYNRFRDRGVIEAISGQEWKNGTTVGEHLANTVIQKHEADLKRAIKQYEQLADKEKRNRENRENYQKDVIRFQKEFQQYQGKELSNYDKARIKLGYTIEKYDELNSKAMKGNKYDQATLYTTMEQLVRRTREFVAEQYKAARGYDDIKKRAEDLHKTLTRTASLWQRVSAGIGSLGQVFSTLRAQAKSVFGYLTNSVRRLTSEVRSTLNTAIKDGIDQFTSLESAKIAFESFYGPENAEGVLATVRAEALKTPIVTAGELADYVQQLAPVSKGNADLAINAALGALKTVAYSGSDTAEMEYVIKNIRDVIAKGTATAIDIRQFNRAMPGLETALKKMGYEKFLNSEGQLKVDKSNVGEVLGMFAKLNTDKDSPLAKINERQLQTLNGMLALFKERRTTMTENVLKRGGVFELAQDILGIGQSQDVWQRMEDFFTKYVNRVVVYVRSIDWDYIGKKLRDGFWRINAAVREAYTQISTMFKETVGVTTKDEAFELLWTVIKKFIEGFRDGAKMLIATVNEIKNALGEDGFAKLAQAIGFLVSPAGKIISTLLSLTRDLTAGLSRAYATLDSVTNKRNERTLKRIQGAAGKYANKVTSESITGARQLYSASGVKANLYGNKVIAGNAIYQNGERQLLRNSKGQISTWDNLTNKEKAKYVGGSSSVINRLSAKMVDITSKTQSIMSKLQTGITKMFTGASTALMISGITDTFTSIAKTTKLFGDSTEGVTSVMTILGKTIGGAAGGAQIGGVAGGLIGAALGAATALIQLKDSAEKAKAEDAKKRMQTALDREHQIEYDALVKYLQDIGIEVDTESDVGNYASEKMKQYINQFEDPSAVDYNQAAKIFADAVRFKKTGLGISDYTETAEFNNIGGRALDWAKDKEYRDRLVNVIKYFRLLGDDYNYSAHTGESMAREFAHGKSLTDKQVEVLEKKWKDYDELYGESITKLVTENDANNSEHIKGAADQLKEAADEQKEAARDFRDSTHWVMAKLGLDEGEYRLAFRHNDKDYNVSDYMKIASEAVKKLEENGSEDALAAAQSIRDKMRHTQAIMNTADFDMSKEFSSLLSDDYEGIINGLMANYGVEDAFESVFAINKLRNATTEALKTYFAEVEGITAENVMSHLDDKTVTDLELIKEMYYKDMDDATKEEFTNYAKTLKDIVINTGIDYMTMALSNMLDSLGTDLTPGEVMSAFGLKQLPGSKLLDPRKNPKESPVATPNGGNIKAIILRRASGGTVPSRGVDTVPAMLQPGEFVVNKPATAKAGLGALYAINRGDLTSAARSIGTKIPTTNTYAKTWQNIVNNNQRTSTAHVSIYNRTSGGRMNTYSNLANKIALA